MVFKPAICVLYILHHQRNKESLPIELSTKSRAMIASLPPHLRRSQNPICRLLAALHARRSSTIVTPVVETMEQVPPPSSTSFAPLGLDQSVRSTWAHRAWVALGSLSIAVALTNSVLAAVHSGTIIKPILAAVLGYILADLATGIYHFAVDNYGGPSTPIFGSQIEAFQRHHRRPSNIARREPANNLYALARGAFFAVVPLELAVVSTDGDESTAAATHAFIGVCAGLLVLSQQFHAWAHGTKGKVPRWVEALQRAGVLIPRDMHRAHHKMPYNNNYCIVSGMWNKVLDENKVFDTVEMIVFFVFGVRPRSWGEPTVEWIEGKKKKNEG